MATSPIYIVNLAWHVVQRALIRIITRRFKVFFIFERILNGTYSNLLQHLGWYLSFDRRYTAGKKTRQKTGNSKIGLITYTFGAQIIISQQRN